MDEAHPIPSVGAVIVDEGRILVVLRGGGAHAGEWAVPGGRQQYGETMDEAVRREVREETGLEIEVGDPLWIGDIIDDSDPPSFHYAVVDFAAFVIGGELLAGDDAADVRWVDLGEVRELPLTPTMFELLTDLGY
jgi:acetyl-CoA carboxylase carboxyl transferase subunit beta